MRLRTNYPVIYVIKGYYKAKFSHHAKNHNITIKELLGNNKKRVFQMVKEGEEDFHHIEVYF